MSGDVKFTFTRDLEPVAVVTLHADEARFIADLIPDSDGASKEWDWIARRLEDMDGGDPDA